MRLIDVSTEKYPDKFAIVDDDAPKEVFKHKWFPRKSSNGKLYICRDRHIGMKSGKQVKERVWLHRLVNQTPKDMDTDHINGDTLDNRRENLRTVTRTQNNYNVGLHSNNTSGHTGVIWNKNREKWEAQIQYKGKHIYLGRHKDKKDAIEARKEAEAIYVD